MTTLAIDRRTVERLVRDALSRRLAGDGYANGSTITPHPNPPPQGGREREREPFGLETPLADTTPALPFNLW